MTATFALVECAADAFRAGHMTLHCIPAPADSGSPVLAGARVDFVAKAAYGKLEPLGFAFITEVARARLDLITDDEIRAAGYPNWTLFSATWTALYGAKGFSWDVDPDAWMIRFSVTG